MSLSARDLCLSVAGFSLLRNVSIDVEPGRVTAIVGPNGAGKTSLLRLLCGEHKPSSGQVLLNHRPLQQWPLLEKAQVLSILPQSSDLSFPFTAREVVALGRTPHDTGVLRDREIIAAALNLVDCSYLDQRAYTQMSGGEKQRVQLARVLGQIWEPPAGELSGMDRYLILDEPTSAFDLSHQRDMLKIMRNLADQGIGILVVLHDLNLAARCADQMVVLSQGEVVVAAEPEQVLTPAILQDVFGVEAEISVHPVSGRPLVIL